MTTTRKVILSFDDGPTPSEPLHKILAILQRNQIKAEFYVLGKSVKGNPKDTMAIFNAGHKIQNHSWDHIDLSIASEVNVLEQIKSTQDAVEKITGYKPTRIRPPYGAGGWPKSLDPELAKVAKDLGLTIHNWDIDTNDWKKPRGLGSVKIKRIRAQIERTGKPRLNILMHVRKETARDLQGFIDLLKGMGFDFARPSS